MSVFKCKMCGGELSPKEGETVVTCPFCGTRQTISTCSDERKTNLFNRANSLRIKNEFDKALLAYQTILADSPNDAEAHWGATLCRYGIEYVDDPKTGKKIPTCHRASYESILSDSDYKAALANSDMVAREEYRTEAEQISDIQKGILSISQKEDPFDIFVCYKETDERGDRTPDSVLAQQIYDELVKKGYKVFFSRITLESKLGTAYEPYIFAALNSSKVMLVIGTKPDYFNAVWVKNEWSRFIALMQGKADKFVVPCFRNMDAYDMPEELLGFQSQDMGKIGAMQDLLRGVDKLMGRDAVKTKIETKTTVIQSDVNIEGLLTRAEILIGDGNFEKADELLEKVLNNDPKNVKAYVLKMLEGFKLASVDEISSLDSPIDDDYNFKKAYQFADTEERKTLDGYNQSILDRLENERLERLYQNALEFKNKGLYIEAVTSFSGLVGYKDSDKQLAECTKLGKEGLYKHALSAKDLKNYDEAITVFEKIQDFQDSKDQIEFCKKAKEDARKEAIYGAAILPDDIDLLNEMKKAEDGVSAMRSISGYKDSDSLAARYQEKIDSFKAEQKRLAEEKAKQAKIKKDKFKLFLKIFLPCLAFVVGMILLTTLYIVPEVKFTKAVDMINSGDYDNAIEVLTNIGSFNDAPNQIKMAEAGKSFKSGDYETGIDYIYNLGGTVNVNYDGNGGTPDRDSSTVKKGKYIDDTSSRGGYTFYGWVLDQYQLHAAKDSYGADIKLKASYEPITYTITFDLNGGTSDSLPKAYTMDVVCDIPNPLRTGYSFTGWTGTGLSDPTKDLSLPAGTMGNKSYKANWKANEYYIHYDPAGGKISSAAQKVVFDSAYTLLSAEQGGYDFLGWFDSSGTQFQTSGVWKKASDVYLTAKWQAINYTITYYLDGGTNSPLNKTSYTISASAIILSDPSKTGYTFDGWTGNGTNSPTKSLKIEAGTYGNLSFTAHWNANQYAVAFDPNGGVVDPVTATYTYDSNATLPTPTRVGYAFAGWYNGTTEVSSGVWKNANDVTLTAHWTANTDTKYVVNYYQQDIYDDNYALAETQAMVGTTDTSVTPYVRTYEGFTSPSAQTVNVSPDGTQVINYYYTRNEYEITFVTNGGSSVSSISLRYQEAIPSYVSTTRTGHSFGGWFTSADQTEQFSGMPASAKTVYAWWSDETKAGCFNYSVTASSANVGSNKNASGSVVIPEYIAGERVTSISSSAFKGSSSISSVSIPSSVLEIKESTFEGCVSLTNVTISDSVTSIGQRAFFGCSSLRNVFVPDSVTSIGAGAFGGCSSLTKIDLPFVGGADSTIASANSLFGYIFGAESYSGGVLTSQNCYGVSSKVQYYLPASLVEVNIRGGHVLYGAFSSCSKIVKLAIGQDADCLSQSCFYSMDSLRDLTIPFCGLTESDVSTSLKDTQFSGSDVSKITRIEVHSGKIIDAAFSSFSGVTEAVLDEGVTSIGKYAFSKMPISGITIPSTCTSIGANAFDGSGLTEIVVPQTVKTIGLWAFQSCSKLVKISLPFIGVNEGTSSDTTHLSGLFNGYLASLKTVIVEEGCTSLGDTAFGAWTGLSEIALPSTLKTIGKDAFYHCTSLASLQIPEGVTTIGDDAFQGCTSLLSVALPNSVTSIGQYSFDGDSLLSSVVLSSSLSELPMRSFQNCASLKTIDLQSVTVIGPLSFYGCTSLSSISFNDSTETVGWGSFEGCSSLTTVVVPDSVTAIGSNAFLNCTSLKSLTIPFVGYSESETDGSANAKITSIGIDSTFAGEIVVTGGKIGTSSFAGLSKLTKVRIPSTITAIGDSAFSACAALQSIVLPDGVLTIGKASFQGCVSLTTANFPSSLTAIGDNAFDGCASLNSSLSGCDSLSTIGSYAFRNAGTISVYIGNSVTTIGIDTFKGDTIPSVVWNAPSIDTVSYRSTGNYGSPFQASAIGTVTFGNSVLSIPENAFADCSVGSVTIPSSVQKIGICAFAACTNTDFGSPILSDITYIGAAAFYGCQKIGNLTLGSSLSFKTGEISRGSAFESSKIGTLHWNPANALNSSGIFKSSSIDSIVIGDSVLAIPEGCFSDIASAGNVSISDSVQSVGNGAFSNFKGTFQINATNSIVSIGSTAFSNCVGLASISCFQNVETIGDSGFSGCTGLAAISSTDFGSLTSIGKYAFSGCTSLLSVYISSSVTSLGEYAFNGCSALSDVTLPFVGSGASDGAGSLIGYTFDYSGSSPTHYLPSHVKKVTILSEPSIPDGSFQNCTSITDVSLLSGVSSIGASAFSGCTSLANVNLPSSLTIIYSSAFDGCSSLKSVVLPSSLARIGDYSFEATGLTEVTIPESVTTCGGMVFGECSSLKMIYWNAISVVSANLFAGSSSPSNVSIVFGSKVKNVPSGLFDAASFNGGTLIYGSCADVVTSVAFSSSIEKISENAFKGCKNADFTFPSSTSLTVVGDYSFEDCEKLSYGSYFSKLVSIGTGSFKQCAFSSVILSKTLVSIGSSAFSNCASLSSVTFESGSIISSIGSYAFFQNASLNSIIIPSTVATMGTQVFEYSGTLTINCESASQPSGWDSSWAQKDTSDSFTIVWGYSA